MKIYTSYFAQMRNFPKNLVSLSTAVWNPKWLPLGRDKQGHIWLDIPPLKPGYNCNGLCNGKCNPKHPQDCAFLQEYRKQLNGVDIHTILNELQVLKNDIEVAESLENVEFVLLFFETPDNPCSERQAVIEWLKENNIETEEWKKI